jgi:hypothetical protein
MGDAVAGKPEDDGIAIHFQGGPFAAEEWSGDLDRTLWSRR